MHDQIFNILKDHFQEAAISFEKHYDFTVYHVAPQEIANIISFLKDSSATSFGFLTTLCGIHYPEKTGQELCVMYQLHNLMENKRIRIKTFLPIDCPQLPSIANIFKAANWQERETYDFFGIEFIGHPNLKRILNMDEMNYFPLRKEYPLEDLQRDDKNDALFGRSPNLTNN